MNRHLFQSASKTGRQQVMIALTLMHAVKNTNFQRKDTDASQAMTSVQDYRKPSSSITQRSSCYWCSYYIGTEGQSIRDPSKRNEDGNFSFFVDWKFKYHLELKDNLNHGPSNAKYTFPRIQNSIINLADIFIRNRVRASISKYWSVMADETHTRLFCNWTTQYMCAISQQWKWSLWRVYWIREAWKIGCPTIADTLLHALQEWGIFIFLD